MELEGWQLAAGVVTSVLGGGGLTAILNWMSQRSKDHAAARDAVQEEARKVIATALESARSQIESLQGEVSELREQAAELRQEVADLRAQHQECEANTAELKREIDRLMQGNPAEYTTIKRPSARRSGNA